MLELPTFLSPLEKAVIDLIINGLPSACAELRIQLNGSRLESREHNGYGFYTTFAIPEDAPAAALPNAQLAASALVDDQLGGFLLWIRDGKVDFLEGYPLGGDAWPSNEQPLTGDAWPENEDIRELRLNKNSC